MATLPEQIVPTPVGMIGLYVHVPFCRVKCGYCDFYSHVGGPEAFEPLVETLLTECDAVVVRRGGVSWRRRSGRAGHTVGVHRQDRESHLAIHGAIAASQSKEPSRCE